MARCPKSLTTKLVENPFTISLYQLVEEFEQITLPVTLVCAGNRRKEQNTPNGHYGTSLKLNWALDPNRGIMLAHGMNGAPLRADHGRPLRAVVPGQIGGRSVKWLRRLMVTAEPSDNWYHYYDNKVLPISSTTVTPEQSAAEPAWWRDERYAIYDLNVNSAVAEPQHNEVLDLASHAPDYTIRGYAYSGGGRRVTRMEVSLDSGKSWRLADVQYPEDRYRNVDIDLYGGRLDMSTRETCFCWCFWAYTVPIYELQSADSILVRGMDEAMMCQPRDMYWSVLGMMNNPWFRVAIIKTGETSLRFEHPTSLTIGNPGWMERVKKAGGDLLNGRWGEKSSADLDQPVTPPPEEVRMTNPDVKRVFSIDEFKSESSPERPLFVINGEVYDGTGYLKDHPGGAQSIQAVAASDATEEFMAIHSENAKLMMSSYHIGSLDEKGRQVLRSQDANADALSPTRAVFLDARHWAKAVLSEVISVSWDTKVFTFKLDHEGQDVGLPVGQHLMLRVKDPDTDEAILRAYTPVSDNTQKGTLKLLIKLYLATPTVPGGRMTTALDKVPIGTALEFKGPVGKFEYIGRGKASIGGEERSVSSFVMICGGSGITPIFQVFRAVILDADDTTPCTVLNGNRNEEDILCRQELDDLCLAGQRKTSGPSCCEVIHALSRPPSGWTGLSGRISENLLREKAAPIENRLALVCGPPAMEIFVRDSLGRMGWKESDLVFF
ncbi:hypothetical protein SEUCBS140593_004628 [Sporothrix eucalyptigena]|uniref:Nitrate reductase [NADPH] n=1 Tax=Sporothrix eucalyptigena TaxID=1812306 RepID=A0ABP0BPJ7_9PEZI